MVWYSFAQLQAMAAGGRIRPTDPFYDARVGAWRLARDTPEIASYLPSVRAPWARLGVLATLAALALTRQHEAEQERLSQLPWDELRRAIFRRDAYTCAYCGHRGTSATLEVDHRLPVSRGGSDHPQNLTTACWKCNRDKSDMTDSEYRWYRLWR